MNSDFTENEYFYNQLNSQGERDQKETSIGPLSLLPNPIPSPTPIHVPEESPTEEVHSATKHVPEMPVESILPNAITPITPPESPEVREPSNPSEILSIEANHDNKEGLSGEEGREANSGEPKLPPRANKGAPPKRYSPDWKGKKTQYSVVMSVKAQMTEMA